MIFREPWKRVEDDDGHVLMRGERAAVCAKTYEILTSPPYARETIGVVPPVPIPSEKRRLFDCARTALRHPLETKGFTYTETRLCDSCETDGRCC